MKKKKYLPLYYKWMKAGHLPSYGLCRQFGDELKIFEPTLEYSKQMFSWVEDIGDWYWAYNGNNTTESGLGDERGKLFTPMRQNIVLFLAAMNKEL